MKIYHAHGCVIHSDNKASGDEIWERDSAFSEVFFDFDEAKKYLLEKFEKLLYHIHYHDKMYEGASKEERDITKAPPGWRREYIDEYISYCLEISELDPEYAADPEPIDFTKPQRIDWYFFPDGEVATRDYVFGKKEYECRESDLLPEAGTKFKVGDLVEYVGRDDWFDETEHLVVLSVPQKPQDKTTPWENHYEVAYIKNDYGRRRGGRIGQDHIHEADLKLCNLKEWEDLHEQMEPILALQKVVTGEAKISPKLKEKILNGGVLFNNLPSWREIPELYDKKTEDS